MDWLWLLIKMAPLPTLTCWAQNSFWSIGRGGWSAWKSTWKRGECRSCLGYNYSKTALEKVFQVCLEMDNMKAHSVECVDMTLLYPAVRFLWANVMVLKTLFVISYFIFHFMVNKVELLLKKGSNIVWLWLYAVCKRLSTRCQYLLSGSNNIKQSVLNESTKHLDKVISWIILPHNIVLGSENTMTVCFKFIISFVVQ